MPAFAAGLGALLLVGATPAKAPAMFMYTWLTTSGPTLHAGFRVPDSVVAGGMIKASDILSPPGFSASASQGAFTDLAADSALAVDPATGTVLDSTNSITATNASNTLLISAFRYLIPTVPQQPSGRGIWKVTYLPATLSLAFLGFTNGQPQLQVTSSVDTTFTLEASADLAQWTPILTNTVVGGVCTVTDPRPVVGSGRFYRGLTSQ